MREILIDTSVLIDLLERRLPEQSKELLRSPPVSISIIAYYEVCRHFLRIGKTKELEFVKQKLRTFKTNGIGHETCEEAAKLSHSHGLSLADSLILATARLNGLKLATSDHDLKGFPETILLKSRK